MPDTISSLLILIPAYNEADRIEPVLNDYATFFREKYAGRFEIMVVLNGCRDNTLEVVQRAAAKFPEIKSLDFPAPIGKGGALIEGLKFASRADLVGYVDADGATSPKAFLDLVQHCGVADCAIGSRWIPGAVLYQQQSRKRQVFSRIFHLMVQTLFRMNIVDTQCGAKVMKREAIERIHASLRIADVAFDINLLYCLKRERYKVLEVPTEWTDKAGSKIRLNRGALGIVLSVIRLRLIYSPFYSWLRPFRPVEAWIYKSLRAPQPLPSPPKQKTSDQSRP